METLTFKYPAASPKDGVRAHVGVVGSGDLEILFEPCENDHSEVTVLTSVDGYGEVWKHVLERFFARYTSAVRIEIHDFGATPGVVLLRLEQAAEASRA
ncbi:malonate decarboxylase subunit delta [Pendulispora rubella]|uniref:Malonate decarboxylase acyl carrier protein n=1 Tax=Pendulispora rubella TaxID=2741070 RepID=A0ABZ2LFD7_9BACT